MSKLKVSIGSPPDRNKVVAMIDCGGEQFAEINQETEDLRFEIYPRRGGQPWIFSLADVNSAIQVARHRLSGKA